MSNRALTAGELQAMLGKQDKWCDVVADVRMLQHVSGTDTYTLNMTTLKVVGVRERVKQVVLELEGQV
jgi:hypothetical protein